MLTSLQMIQANKLEKPNNNFPSTDKLHLKNCMRYSTYILSATRYEAYKAAVVKTTYYNNLCIRIKIISFKFLLQGLLFEESIVKFTISL